MINRDGINKAITKCTVFKHSQRLYVALLLLILSVSVFEANAQTQIQGARDNPQVYSGVVYGPIDQNDTLWRIASRYKQDSQFTVYQTMLAIYELNPQAFENGNFNTMVNGAILQLPSDRYIARVDHQQARAKADTDDRALGRSSNTADSASNEQASNTKPQSSNLKPVVPLVNQEDLSKTSSQLQSQLNSLKQQQQQQFEQLKNQVAMSIDSVEILLQENKKLNDQLLKIDENNRNLTQQVETELQTQINTQVDQLNQLIAIVKDAEQRRIDKDSQSILQMLSTPLALIIIMSSVTLLLIIGLALFLLRKPTQETSVEPTKHQSVDIVDDDLVIGEVDESLDQDSEDLMAALSQDDDLEEDDILSDALEDDDNIKILSDDDMEAELEGLDDMLVPDSPSDLVDFESTDENLASDKDDLAPLDNLDSNTDINNDKAISKPAEVDNTDSDSSGTPSGIELDENGDIDENTIDQISNQIEEKDLAITKMTDELLDELDKEPSENNLDPSQDDETSVETPPEITDTSLDSLLDENEEGDYNEADSESIAELDELDELLDSIDNDNNDVNDEDLSAVTDDDLDKLIDLDGEDDVDTTANETENDQVSTLTDELLEELESDNFEADELENLLDEMENNELNGAQEDVFIEESQLDTIDNIDSNDISDNSKQVDSVMDADDLLDDIPSFTTSLSEDESDTVNDSDQDIKNTVSDENNSETKVSEEKANIDNNESLKDESDEEMLSGLQGLDNWLDEEDETQLEGISETVQEDELDFSALELDMEDIDSLSNTNSDEDNLISDLESADFDDMLNELGDDSSAEQGSSESSKELEKAKLSTNNDPIDNAGLDLEALMTSVDPVDEVNKDERTDSDDFVDVDDLLMESEAMAKPSDDEMALDLDSSLDKLMANEDSIHDIKSDSSDAESNQSSNLDLALVYIDMEDFVAAKELLEEVTRLGTQEQQEEAKTLLDQIKS